MSPTWPRGCSRTLPDDVAQAVPGVHLGVPGRPAIREHTASAAMRVSSPSTPLLLECGELGLSMILV
jgi:hypothetical protein